jgi:hypothetical protein
MPGLRKRNVNKRVPLPRQFKSAAGCTFASAQLKDSDLAATGFYLLLRFPAGLKRHVPV